MPAIFRRTWSYGALSFVLLVACGCGTRHGDDAGSCTDPADCVNGTCTGTPPACVCAEGFQDHDHDNVCAPICAAGQCLHGTCSDASGTATCTCDPPFMGPACDQEPIDGCTMLQGTITSASVRSCSSRC